MKTALITGASSGIGLDLAKIMAAQHYNLILVARNISVMEELKQQLEKTYPIQIQIIGLDLSDPKAADTLYKKISEKNISIDILINNAGFGEIGFFHESKWEKTAEMIQLNVVTLVHLTRLFLTDMVKRKQGRIMNVASTAAFQPGPLMAIYFATKSFVLSFSEAIANELQGTGVTVTALCPGATASGFQKAAGMESSRMFKDRKLPSSKQVAQYGYKAMMKGKRVAIHGTINYLLANIIRFVPRNLVTAIARKVVS